MKRFVVGDVITCRVSGISTYGIFVIADNQYKGLIHISEVSSEFVRDINDYVKKDDIIYAKIINVDSNLKQLKLSIKDIDYANTGMERNLINQSKGFNILKENLPLWMDKKLKEYEKKED